MTLKDHKNDLIRKDIAFLDRLWLIFLFKTKVSNKSALVFLLHRKVHYFCTSFGCSLGPQPQMITSSPGSSPNTPTPIQFPPITTTPRQHPPGDGISGLRSPSSESRSQSRDCSTPGVGVPPFSTICVDLVGSGSPRPGP